MIGFATAWDGEKLDAISCGLDPDDYELWPVEPLGKVRLEQSWDTGVDVGNLALEAFCGMTPCLFNDTPGTSKALDLEACGCPEGERVFVRVGVAVPLNPPQGTRHTLSLG